VPARDSPWRWILSGRTRRGGRATSVRGRGSARTSSTIRPSASSSSGGRGSCCASADESRTETLSQAATAAVRGYKLNFRNGGNPIYYPFTFKDIYS